jgi:prepilin-type N-terminal cleavage/methylation domain-containing protein
MLRISGARTGGDGGMTLIEVLIAVVLLGLAGTAILSLWSAGIKASGTHRKVGDAQAVVAGAAERVGAQTPWLPCSTGTGNIRTAYETAARTSSLPSSPGWSTSAIVVESVEYWNGNDSGDVFDTTCRDAFPMRQITIRVNAPGGDVERLQVVKSNG